MTDETRNRWSRRGLAGAAALLPVVALAAPAAAAPASGESTFERVMRTKKLRVSALTGELPYFDKDLATGKWTGFANAMALNIAGVFGAEVVYVDATWGTSVLDLQTNKVDLSFALNPTPERALAIGFSEPIFIHPFGCIAKPDFKPTTWADIDKPGLKIGVSVGSLYQTLARQYAPKATAVGLTSSDACILAYQSGRADIVLLAAIPGLAAIGKNPSLGSYAILSDPVIALPSSLGIRRETDTRFRDVLNAWIEYNGGVGEIRQWVIQGLALEGVKPDQLPENLTF